MPPTPLCISSAILLSFAETEAARDRDVEWESITIVMERGGGGGPWNSHRYRSYRTLLTSDTKVARTNHLPSSSSSRFANSATPRSPDDYAQQQPYQKHEPGYPWREIFLHSAFHQPIAGDRPYDDTKGHELVPEAAAPSDENREILQDPLHVSRRDMLYISSTPVGCVE